MAARRRPRSSSENRLRPVGARRTPLSTSGSADVRGRLASMAEAIAVPVPSGSAIWASATRRVVSRQGQRGEARTESSRRAALAVNSRSRPNGAVCLPGSLTTATTPLLLDGQHAVRQHAHAHLRARARYSFYRRSRCRAAGGTLSRSQRAGGGRPSSSSLTTSTAAVPATDRLQPQLKPSAVCMVLMRCAETVARDASSLVAHPQGAS
jgi:hypothetical protein